VVRQSEALLSSPRASPVRCFEATAIPEIGVVGGSDLRANVKLQCAVVRMRREVGSSSRSVSRVARCTAASWTSLPRIRNQNTALRCLHLLVHVNVNVNHNHCSRLWAALATRSHMQPWFCARTFLSSL
jgi:hypothetical protein